MREIIGEICHKGFGNEKKLNFPPPFFFLFFNWVFLFMKFVEQDKLKWGNGEMEKCDLEKRFYYYYFFVI